MGRERRVHVPGETFEGVTELTLSIRGARASENVPLSLSRIQDGSGPRLSEAIVEYRIHTTRVYRNPYLASYVFPSSHRDSTPLPLPPARNRFIILMTRLARCPDPVSRCSPPPFSISSYLLFPSWEVWFRRASSPATRVPFSRLLFATL